MRMRYRDRAGGGTLLGAGLIITGSVSGQLSAVLSSRLFPTIGPLGASGLRFLVAALALSLFFRPSFRGRTRIGWVYVICYGFCMAALNVCFYAAIVRLPLGVAVTVQILGPIGVAILGARRKWEYVLPVVALAGVWLICRPGGGVTLPGLLLAGGSAVAYAGYVMLAGRVGAASKGWHGLSLAVSVASLMLLPISISALPRMQFSNWGLIIASAVVGLGVGFSCDFVAVKMVSARTVGTLFVLEPVVAALVGVLFLREVLTVSVLVGMGLVILSGAAVVWGAGRGPAVSPMASPQGAD